MRCGRCRPSDVAAADRDSETHTYLRNKHKWTTQDMTHTPQRVCQRAALLQRGQRAPASETETQCVAVAPWQALLLLGKVRRICLLQQAAGPACTIAQPLWVRVLLCTCACASRTRGSKRQGMLAACMHVCRLHLSVSRAEPGLEVSQQLREQKAGFGPAGHPINPARTRCAGPGLWSLNFSCLLGPFLTHQRLLSGTCSRPGHTSKVTGFWVGLSPIANKRPVCHHP
jgi:hypothetical protein